MAIYTASDILAVGQCYGWGICMLHVCRHVLFGSVLWCLVYLYVWLSMKSMIPDSYSWSDGGGNARKPFLLPAKRRRRRNTTTFNFLFKHGCALTNVTLLQMLVLSVRFGVE